MTAVLGIDSSTPQVAVGLFLDGRLVGRRVAGGRRTGAVLPVAAAELLADEGLRPADLDAVGVGVGPGPYTSLRVGVMFARAVGLAVGTPVVGACSLDVVARAVDPAGEAFLVAADARRREVYWARYDAAGRRREGPLVGPPDAVRHAHSDLRWMDARDAYAPDAGVLAAWVAGAMAEGAGVPAVAQVGHGWDAAGGDGSAGPPVPQALLAPEPLYVRRPDAVVPEHLGGGAA
ncbi:MAG: tRNA (adenosine(37)-N6)-threonylcarbamoyltransferase complex dimerization subunit type 1 TsaB [Candidatus Nanopelagicales bacterium]